MANSKSQKSKPKAAKKVAAKKPVAPVVALRKKVSLRDARALKKAGKFASVREALKA